MRVRPKRRALTALRLCVVLLLGVLATAWTSPAAAEAPTRLAVLYFENQGNPDLEMLKLGLAQMVITDLAPHPDLEVVERTRINEILGELELQTSNKIDPDSAVRIGKVLGVEYLIQGYYLYFAPVDSLVIGAQIVAVETGAVVSGFRSQGKQADFLDLQAQLVQGLLPKLRAAAGRTPIPEPAVEPTPEVAPEPTPEVAPDPPSSSPGGVRRGGGRATRRAEHAQGSSVPVEAAAEESEGASGSGPAMPVTARL